ncbi:cysteine hydrolase [Pelagibius litoralis]|uniref:Cysteine hydrolase n=1 Tax=Pelagibius litoralis TaxID=374515 RepID=A0A967F0E3_9PROT|nr:cysteine hydrolase family protein [Pelagibius litoralis]NIA70701.1 cysteine hydrolase [Pelagibius litoralis]
MSNTALVLVDIQNDYFEDGRWPVDKMQAVSANAARLLALARDKGQTLVHVRHEIPSDEAPFFRPGTPGAEIHAAVAPKEGEPVILKHRPNSFQNTSLRQDLEAKGVTEVVICGATSQMCIDATARAAADFGFAVTVVEDACGAKEQAFNDKTVPAPQVHAAFMAPLAMTYARVVSTDAYLSEIE